MEQELVLSAEDRAKQIFEQTKATEGTDDFSELDELNIIENKGIEYVLRSPGLDDLRIYVAPLKISRYRVLFEMQEGLDKLSMIEQMERSAKAFSDIFRIPYETLIDYLDADDVRILSGLLVCGLYEGKKIFGKKKFKISESKTMQSFIGRAAPPPSGSPTI